MAYSSRLRAAVGLVLALAALPAGAAPFDREVHLVPGGPPHFERFAGLARLSTSPPDRLHAEQLPSGEILLEGRAPGEAVLFLQADGAIRAWRVVVGEVPEPDVAAATETARRACGGLGTEDGRIAVRLGSEACRAAVVTLSRRLPARELVVQLDEKGLRAQLAAQQAAFAAAVPGAEVRLAYLGATLRLSGRIPRPALDAALRAVWAVTAGPLLLDVSDLEVEDGPKPAPADADEAAPDGGPAPRIEVIRGFDEAHPPE